MESLWEKTAGSQDFEPLTGNRTTDVLIIGGGMAGLLCAFLLQQAGVDYMLIEAQTVCDGITKNTTAKLTSQHGLIYNKLLRRFGYEKAKQYLYANEAALAKIRALCQNIDCDFEEKDAYVYSVDNRAELERELTALHRLKFSADLTERLPLPFPVAGAIRFQKQAQFHPLKFAAALRPGLQIYEHTPAGQLAGRTVFTHRGRITAQNIIVATHFPFLNRHGGYFLKLYQHRSYVIGLEDAPDLQGMYVDAAENGLAFRNYQGLLLLGGGGHRTGKQGGGWQILRSFAVSHYPEATECCHWAAQDCMSLDGVPYIGPYAGSTEGLYVATGFNKWGMTSSMVAAMLLTDIVLGRENPYADVFSPSRSILRPQLTVNALEAIGGLLTPSRKRCTHLGCALKWNQYEHTWDCPCHGSRFTQTGSLIDNPAMQDMRK